MLNLLRMTLLFSKSRKPSEEPKPWESTPNSEVGTISIESTFDWLLLSFESSESRETGTISIEPYLSYTEAV